MRPSLAARGMERPSEDSPFCAEKLQIRSMIRIGKIICQWRLINFILFILFHLRAYGKRVSLVCFTDGGFSVKLGCIVVPSSSGPGRLVLIQKIKGSTPFGITIFELELPSRAIFYFRSVNNSASNKEIIQLGNSILENNDTEGTRSLAGSSKTRSNEVRRRRFVYLPSGSLPSHFS